MVRNRAEFCLAVAMGLGVAVPGAVASARAQDAPAVTVAGGFTRVVDEDVRLDGFFVEAERQLSPRFAAVGQVHRVTAGKGGSFSTIDWTDVFAGAGVRFTMRRDRLIRPHAHALAGLYRISNDVTLADPRPGFSPTISNTDSYAAFVVGAGVNVMPGPRIGFRAGFDVQVLPGVLPTGRLTAGVVVPIGRR